MRPGVLSRRQWLGRAASLLASARASLLAARATRVPPHLDRKILASWNGLMISAFARAASVLGEPVYAEQATRAAAFVLERMRPDGRLRRSVLSGPASGDAYLDDYAFLVAGLLDLYEATFDPRWLDEAVALQSVLDAHYWDADGGGLGSPRTTGALARTDRASKSGVRNLIADASSRDL